MDSKRRWRFVNNRLHGGCRSGRIHLFDRPFDDFLHDFGFDKRFAVFGVCLRDKLGRGWG